MVLRQYIELVNDTPTRLHFLQAQVVARTVTDPVSGQTKGVRAWQALVDELDGKAVASTFSTLSDKLASQLDPWRENGRLPTVDFVITQRGDGFARSWQVEVVPRGAPRG